MKEIDFYFDFLSPYSYVAWTWVREQKYKFNYIPVSVPSIISHLGTLGPAQIVPKRNYLFKDLLRYTRLNNIPFTTPMQLPFNSLYALRLALPEVSGSSQKEVIDAIFRAGWEFGQDIGSDDVLKNILTEAGLPAEEFFAKMESKESRVQLKSNIGQAIGRNLFGVPSFLVDEEIFWGNDSIKYLEMHLSGSDPLDHEKYKIFLSKHQF
ncbi:MAG: 2-hydroxychromene-2-carboxylate isomerase [Bacteriovorax sp.]|jgi:2-hydroxychromene-2-carboxylate isomerase